MDDHWGPAHLQRGVPEPGEGGLPAQRAQVVQQRLREQAHGQAQAAVRAAQAAPAARVHRHGQVADQRDDDLAPRKQRPTFRGWLLTGMGTTLSPAS